VVLVALAVFLLTYAALSVPAVGRGAKRLVSRGGRPGFLNRFVERPGFALLGGLLMVLLGVVAWGDAVAAVNLEVIFLLLGMMALVAGLQAANVFAVVASVVVTHAGNQRRLFVAVMAVTAVLSALVLNDAVVLIFTPILVLACREMEVDPMPYLAAECVAANIGSVATPVGNPQNALIALESGLTFLAFSAPLTPVALACLAVAAVFGLWFFRKDLAKPLAHRPDQPLALITNKPLFVASLLVTALILTGFVVGHLLTVPTPWGPMELALDKVALLGGLLLVLLAWPVGRVAPTRIVRNIDFGILVFFAGLFVLMAGVRESGLLALLYEGLAFIPFATVGGLTVASAVLSNLVSNVPAVVLLLPALHEAARPDLWLALAAASTLAGNATLLGAAANVIVAETAKGQGAEFDVWRFMKFGFPLTVITLLVSWGMLLLLV